jgi:two-component system, sensor histidine kinase and response regulator
MDNSIPLQAITASLTGDPSWQSRTEKASDSIINYFLLSYFVAGLIFAFFYDTWAIGIGVGGLSLLAYYFTRFSLPDSLLHQYVLSAVLGIFMAQFIYQMHGLFEMHFFAFIGSAILITYQNWKLQIPMMIVVTLHHGIFGYLQNLGYGKVYFTQLDYFDLQTFAIHILLAAIIFFISGLWAYRLKKDSEVRAAQTKEVERLQQAALVAANQQKEQLQRHVAVLDKAVAQGKFEVASDFMHDVGNAVVGFGSYLTQIRRLQEENDPTVFRNLAGFFETQRLSIAGAIGDSKTSAVIELLTGIAGTRQRNHEAANELVTKQIQIITQVQDILHIQRQHIEGHDTKERKSIHLGSIINDALALLFAVIDKLSVAVYLDIPDDLPLIKGDRTRLMQVFASVLKNSVDAFAGSMAEKIISIEVFANPGVIMVEVRDTGSGFDAGVGGRLFEEGFSTKASAAGLALCHCRAIMESHAGSISVTSDGPGKGALAVMLFKM